MNGLKVILVPNKANDIIAANMYFRGGSSTLEMSRAGIEELALRVAVLATKNLPKDKLSEEIESMDTRIVPSAGRDYSSISLQCVRQNFGRSWKVFADVILNSSFDSADVALEKAQAIAALRQSKDNPDQYLASLMLEALIMTTRTRRPVRDRTDDAVVHGEGPAGVHAREGHDVGNAARRRRECRPGGAGAMGERVIGAIRAADLPLLFPPR